MGEPVVLPLSAQHVVAKRGDKLKRATCRSFGCRLLSVILYSGKLSSEKTFANFAVLWLFVKVFASKFWAMVSFGVAKASNP